MYINWKVCPMAQISVLNEGLSSLSSRLRNGIEKAEFRVTQGVRLGMGGSDKKNGFEKRVGV